MLVDYHMHTRLADGTGEPIGYAAVALERGIGEICFTEHAPLADRDTDWTMQRSALPEYIDMVRAAQARYPQLSIKLGLEIDYLPGTTAWVRELTAMHPWDFILGSVHFFRDGLPVDRRREDWEGQDVNDRWQEYFALWQEAAQTRLFDSLAHPDLPKKFGLRPTIDPLPLFEWALGVVAANGLAIEVSTAGLRKPCREIYPSVSFLQIANRLGIPVTLGSDSHIAADVGLNFDKAVALLHGCGYRQVCRFNQRQRTLTNL